MHDEKLQNNSNAQLFIGFEIEKLIPLIDWSYFFNQWSIGGRFPEIFDHPTKGVEAKKLYNDALEMVKKMDVTINSAFKIFKAYQNGDDIMVKTCACCDSVVRMPMLRNQTTNYQSVSDFVTSKFDRLTLFALCVHNNSTYKSDYDVLMSEILCNRLADAMQTWVVEQVGRITETKSLAFAFGYPACPDHSPKKLVFELLQAHRNLNMNLTDNFAMTPLSSCCGIVVSHPNINYFAVGKIGDDQLRDYARRAGMTIERLKTIIPNNL